MWRYQSSKNFCKGKDTFDWGYFDNLKWINIKNLKIRKYFIDRFFGL
jgi:hypothetical protein